MFSCGRCNSQLFRQDEIIDHAKAGNSSGPGLNQSSILGVYGSSASNLFSKAPEKDLFYPQPRAPTANFSPDRNLTTQACSEFLIGRQEWIKTNEGHFGNIYCPGKNCYEKLGVYSTLGLKCMCGKLTSPGYLIYKNKCKKVPISAY